MSSSTVKDTIQTYFIHKIHLKDIKIRVIGGRCGWRKRIWRSWSMEVSRERMRKLHPSDTS